MISPSITFARAVHADDGSFTLMTPEGHTLSAWITFSAFQNGAATIVQIQVLERPSDPLDEIAYISGGSRQQTRFWEATLIALARHAGVSEPIVETSVVCVDRQRQWRCVRKLRRSTTIHSMMRSATTPGRRLSRPVHGRS